MGKFVAMERKSENIQEELNRIVDLLKGHEALKHIEDIQDELEGEIDRRTLQRRLKKLIQSGKVITSGKGPATKYKLVNSSEDKLRADH